MKINYDRSRITAEIEIITPEIAAKMLNANTKNRRVKKSGTGAYAADLLNGRFQLNGETIIIDCLGEVLDGQHRLLACESTKISFETVVVRGIHPDARSTIDSGIKRSHSDRLGMRGVPYSSLVSAIAKWLWLMAHGASMGSAVYRAGTPSQLDEILEEHPRIVDSAQAAHKIFPGVQAIVGAIHYIAMNSGMVDRADAMLSVWKTGAPDYPNDPMHIVRERLIRTRGTPSQLSHDVTTRLICAAWRSFAISEPVRSLRPAEKVTVPQWSRKNIVGLEWDNDQ